MSTKLRTSKLFSGLILVCQYTKAAARSFHKIRSLKNFAKLMVKHLFSSLFSIKLH